jgi:hypothetical protein
LIKSRGFYGVDARGFQCEVLLLRIGGRDVTATEFGGRRAEGAP